MFTARVKLYALEQRRSGMRWKQVKQAVRGVFKIPAPGIRAMQKWEKEIDREKLIQAIIEEGKKELPDLEAAALQQVAGGLIPVLWQAKDAGEDIQLQGWLWFFTIIECHLGSQKFNSFMEEYRKHRPGTELGDTGVRYRDRKGTPGDTEEVTGGTDGKGPRGTVHDPGV